MRIAITFRNFEPSESIKQYVREKVAKLQKYLHGPLDATVTCSLERRLHCIDVMIHDGGESYLGQEAQDDMYASIDLVMDKIRHQLRRAKDVAAERRRDVVELPGE